VLPFTDPVWSKNRNCAQDGQLSLSGVNSLVPYDSEGAKGPAVAGRLAKRGGPYEMGPHPTHIAGSADQELLLRNECLVAEDRILKAQLQGRLRLSEVQRARLAEIAPSTGRARL
jgi:hypothetical protein